MYFCFLALSLVYVLNYKMGSNYEFNAESQMPKRDKQVSNLGCVRASVAVKMVLTKQVMLNSFQMFCFEILTAFFFPKVFYQHH